jgi:hypothetical protein
MNFSTGIIAHLYLVITAFLPCVAIPCFSFILATSHAYHSFPIFESSSLDNHCTMLINSSVLFAKSFGFCLKLSLTIFLIQLVVSAIFVEDGGNICFSLCTP